jgi:multiple sugar transport system substrate-binding protein
METIRILGVGDPAVYTYQEKVNEIIKPIEKEFNIQIELHIFSFDKYYKELMDAFEKDEYDIVMVAGHLWLPFFVEEGYLSPLYQNGSGGQLDDILESIKREMFYNKAQYLYPSFCDGHILVYRKNRLNIQVGDVMSILDILDYLDRQEAKNQFTLKAHPSELFLDVLPYFRALNISPISKSGKVKIEDKEIDHVLNLYKKAMKYCNPQVRTFGNDEVRKSIQSGTVDMAVTWGGQLGAVMSDACVEPEQIGFAALKESWNVTWSFGLNAKSKHKSTAVKVIEKLTDKNVDKEIGRKCGNPTRLSNFIEDKDRYPWYLVTKKMIEKAKPLPSTPFLPEAITLLTEVLNNRLSDEGA